MASCRLIFRMVFLGKCYLLGLKPRILEILAKLSNILVKTNYLCDFVVRDIKIAVYLESPGKINFTLVSDFLSNKISQKAGFNY